MMFNCNSLCQKKMCQSCISSCIMHETPCWFHKMFKSLEYIDPPSATTKSYVFQCSKFNHIHFEMHPPIMTFIVFSPNIFVPGMCELVIKLWWFNVKIWYMCHLLVACQMSWNNLSMKQGNLFCFFLSHYDLPNHGISCYAIGIFAKLSMNRGASSLFDIVWNYSVEAIDYWTIFSMKIT
jgi:hypothetical protein